MTTQELAECEEKHRRIYYQSIVYDVCNIIDRHRGDGKQTICGSVCSPSDDVQKSLKNLLANLEPKF